MVKFCHAELVSASQKKTSLKKKKMSMIQVGIIGGAGYTAGELIQVITESFSGKYQVCV